MQTVLLFWIGWAVYFNAAGWGLSAIHQLNPAGYGVALLPPFLLVLVWLKKNPPAFPARMLARRFRRPLPALFLLVAVLVFLGGLLYAPNNYDALAYRLPRMLNWLAAGKWVWVPTIVERMNYSAPGWEWTAMPLLALTHSDRSLFLINAVGYLLLPGLLFSVFRQLGVARRVAWAWMWLLPLAYGYATQAGGIGNDLIGVPCCLASVHFGLRARRSGRVTDVWLALLAAALLSAMKASNLPLGLPCLVAFWPALGQLRKNLIGSLGVAVLAVLISALPIMALNQLHTGSWTGDPQNKGELQVKNPVSALLGNSILLAQQTLMPPVLPAAGKLSQRFNDSLPAAIQERLHRDFPRYYLTKLNELPSEEAAGLGLGIAVPLLIILFAGWPAAGRPGHRLKFSVLLPGVALAAWVSLLVYLLKMGSESVPRLLLPYYPLVLVPVLLLPAQSAWMRRRSWRIVLLLAGCFVLPALILSPARPLWPGRIICGHLSASHPDSALWRRMASVYDAYADRNDVLAPVRAHLPPDVREIGFISGSNDTDYSLWRPFGTRRVISLRGDVRNFLDHPDAVEWVVIKDVYWPEVSPVPLADWAADHHARVVATVAVVEVVTWGPEKWTVVRFAKDAKN